MARSKSSWILWISEGIIFCVGSWFRFANKISEWAWLVIVVLLILAFTMGKLKKLSISATGLDAEAQERKEVKT